jgi:coiled-coil domain-containing protein 12
MGDRKARLAALAAKAGRTKKADEEGEEGGGQDAVDEANKPQSVSFRNYAPADAGLEKTADVEDAGQESPAKRQRVDGGDDNKQTSSALQDALQQAKQEIAVSNGRISSTEEANTAAPKKINWDLKRDIQDKLNKLEKRTQKAIVEMLKERLEKEATEQAGSEESDLD